MLSIRIRSGDPAQVAAAEALIAEALAKLPGVVAGRRSQSRRTQPRPFTDVYRYYPAAPAVDPKEPTP